MGLALQRHAVSSSVLAIACCLGHIGYAGADVAPPARYQKDRNGVDLARGTYSGRVKMLSIGSGNEELPLYLDHRNGRPGTSEYELGIYGDTTSVNVGVLGPNGPASTVFTKVNGVWVSKLGDGATLTQSGTGYVLTLSDGTQYSYDGTLTSVDSNRIARVTSVKYASGRTLTMSYLRQVGCSSQYQQQCGGGSNVPWKVRLISVASSSGYQLHFDYASTIAGDSSWNTLTTITAFNMATDACGITAYSCSFSQNWPAITVAAGAAAGSWTITDNIGRATTFTTTSIRRPGSTTDDLSVTYPSSGYGNVVSVTAAGQTWQYSYSGTYPSTTVTIGNPDGTSRIVTSNVTVGLPTQVTDESGAVTSYTYDSSGRLSTATSPTQVQQRFLYDSRGNVIESRLVSATSGTPADIVTSAGYDPSCGNTITCNQPNWTRDAKNAQTDYVYDPTHGGVTSVTLPANQSGVRPQRRYAYSQLQAYYKNSSGTLVASGAPTYLLTSVSECRSSSSCVNSADESRTVIAYGQPGIANNLLPTSTTVSAGDGSVAAATSFAYNGAGDVVSVDGPILGNADTVRSIYNAARQTTMVIEADPDGTGPLRSRATSYSYDSKGRVTGVVIGTANADGSSFTAVQTLSFGYDAADRKLLASLSTGGTTIAVAQYAYDAMGRTICTASA
ncbi:RHS repeat domain-containing protein [Sphingomonas sp. RIT328]|uniref:RHS repeat domain-containing protein n=1 Tax=Sphingomonas sp. RIT328 TaxID=1470591 RepID=UPI00044610A2|nr:RHS repeat domain-containing protein [Sphingomonas sp. RIT328]EZP56495.1 YD repeat protein precursor [Sphingomonas sp. RIT328]